MALPQITGVQRRGFTLNRAAIDQEARTVTLSFSSESPVPRWYGIEILSHDNGAVRLERLNNRGAVLVNHDTALQVGVIESATVSGGKGRAVVRFSDSQLGSEVFNDIVAGIRANVSVGYRVNKVEPAPKINGAEAFRVTDWEPLEISVVSIPADATVGVGRSYKGTMKEQLEDTPEIHEGANQREYENTMRKVAAWGRFNEAELNLALVRGETVEAFRHRAADKIERHRKAFAAKPLGEAEDFDETLTETRSVSDGLWTKEGCIGMSERDINGYSFLRGIGSIVSNGRLEGCPEAEYSKTAERLYRRSSPVSGFTIPMDVLIHRSHQTRAMTAGSNTAGGFLVATDLLAGNFIDLLRNKAVIGKMGATILTGLRGDVVVPKLTGDVTAHWLAETATVSDSAPTLGQLSLTPHRIAATTPFSKQLAIQTSLDIETLVRSNIATSIALAWDLAAIAGSGASGQPTGILNSTGLSTGVTFGAAATFAKIVEFETNLAMSNADDGNIGWITSPATRGKWKGIARFTSTDTPIWKDDGTVNSYRAFSTKQIPSGDQVLFGNWADLLLGVWNGLDVVVDPYSLATSNQIRVTSQMHCDLGLARPTSFVISADSGAQ